MEKAPVTVKQVYLLKYEDPDPSKSWDEMIHNLIPDVALNKIINDSYVTKAPDPAFAVGLITGPGAAGVASTDTMSSHAGWTEATPYSNAARPALTWGAVASKSTSNSASPAVFNCNASATIGGCFFTSGTAGGGAGNADQKGGTGGTLRGAGAFSSGDKAVSNGGTLTVTITATAS